MSEIFRCENLSKRYGNVLALDNLSLSLESGRIVGLLGLITDSDNVLSVHAHPDFPAVPEHLRFSPRFSHHLQNT